MRLSALAGGLVMAAGLLVLPVGTSVAEQSGPAAPVEQCTTPHPELAELSGLGADGESWYATNDGGTQLEVYVLDTNCSVRDVITSGTDPYDIEDLAVGQDGRVWLADTGDNRMRRNTVAIHVLSPDGGSTLHRLTYPDGPRDAEALLLDRDSTPYVVTKSPFGDSEVFRPAGPLRTPGPTALERVGSMSLSSTKTPGGPVSGGMSSTLITGGAVSSDGRVVALRTYTDAYLYPAPDGDVEAALTREPVRVPLPNEPQGEAIAFTPAGGLLSASEGAGEPVRLVRDATGLVPGARAAPGERGGENGTAAGQPGERGAANDGSVDGSAAGGTSTGDDTDALATIGIGAAVVALVLLIVARFRRRARRSG